jgi:hypothetical protein
MTCAACIWKMRQQVTSRLLEIIYFDLSTSIFAVSVDSIYFCGMQGDFYYCVSYKLNISYIYKMADKFTFPIIYVQSVCFHAYCIIVNCRYNAILNIITSSWRSCHSGHRRQWHTSQLSHTNNHHVQRITPHADRV